MTISADFWEISAVVITRVCAAVGGGGVGGWARAACRVMDAGGGNGRGAVGVIVEVVQREREVLRQTYLRSRLLQHRARVRLEWEELQWMEGSCPFHLNAFDECGFGGISGTDCTARGCCYDETSPHRWCVWLCCVTAL